jgi:hypothetical protein
VLIKGCFSILQVNLKLYKVICNRKVLNTVEFSSSGCGNKLCAHTVRLLILGVDCFHNKLVVLCPWYFVRLSFVLFSPNYWQTLRHYYRYIFTVPVWNKMLFLLLKHTGCKNQHHVIHNYYCKLNKIVMKFFVNHALPVITPRPFNSRGAVLCTQTQSRSGSGGVKKTLRLHRESNPNYPMAQL